jgi:hypothetical protein
MDYPVSQPGGIAIAGTPSLEQLRKYIPTAKRYVVAVHGIGDQFKNATIQSVVAAFGGFFDYPLGVPLGAFRKPPPAISAYKPETPDTPGARPVPDALAETAFVEIYWADIPRKQHEEGYTIEETKAWARTVVARLRARYQDFTTPGTELHKEADETAERSEASATATAPPPHLSFKEYRAVADALEEMIETFEVLGNLLWIAEKAGWFDFDLDRLLTSYVGDVQIVADFEEFRLGILDRFTKVLDAIGITVRENDISNPEIYVVAHSEGTVVAFMGLLLGMCDREVPLEPGEDTSAKKKEREWYKYVRGFMTFGSPIDKHIVLWPDIWKPVKKAPKDVVNFFTDDSEKDARIWWKNYYDKGDPVGFNLDTARDWMEWHGWSRVFRFKEKEDDHGFSRYAMPGQAHNDYWKDAAVFGHFIENVAGLTNGAPRYPTPPKTRPVAVTLSYTLPYLMVYLLCCAGSFFIYKATESFVRSPISLSRGVLDILGIGSLLLGMIGLARILKLTRQVRWIFGGLGVFVACAVPYYFVPQGFQAKQAFWFLAGSDFPHAAGLVVIGVALLSALLAGIIGRTDPRLWRRGLGASVRWLCVGAHPLVIAVTIQVALMVIYRLVKHWPYGPASDKPSLWPVFLAFGAFVYLWWLAILLFDLVFVWHRYIRWQGALKTLRDMRRARVSTEHPPLQAPSPAK